MPLLLASGEGRHAVELAVQPVQVVRKLVQDQVLAVARIPAALDDVLPGKDDRAAVPCFAMIGLALLDHIVHALELGGVPIHARVDDDGLHAVKTVTLLEAQDEQRHRGRPSSASPRP